MIQKLALDRIKEHTFLKRYLNSNSRVVDLGMNRGGFASTLQRVYGCPVVGLEPNPQIISEINFPGVRAINAALSVDDGSVRFEIDPRNSEASKIVASDTPLSDLVVSVPSLSLSTVFQEAGSDQIDLLKIDVEGAEVSLFESLDLSILEGCRQISIEFHSFIYPEHAPRIAEIKRRMRRNGFKVIDFSTNDADVLFVNQRFIRLSALDLAVLRLSKYATGVARRIARAISRPRVAPASATTA